MSLFSKKERLNATAFNRSFSIGKRVHNQYFQLIHHPHTTFSAAVVVGKKVSKKAVQRNLLRRQLYAVLYAFKKENQLQQVIIVITKPAILKLTRQQRRAELLCLLERTFVDKD